MMKQLFEDYLYYLKFVDPHSHNTIESYSYDLKQYFEYLDKIDIKKIEDVEYIMIVNYIHQLQDRYEITTVSRKVTLIKQFHNYCVQYGKTKYNPTSHLENRTRGKNLPKTISLDDVRQLLSFDLKEGKDYMDRAILLILFRCGLRVSECINLEFAQIYDDEKWLRILGKGNKERLVPIAKDAYESLQYYIKLVRPSFVKNSTNKIFINDKGNPITRQYVYRMIQLKKKETGLDVPVSPHTLRHVFATTLLDKEVDLRLIQEILGHADISTTQIYTHVNKDKMKAQYNQYIVDPFKKGEEEE